MGVTGNTGEGARDAGAPGASGAGAILDAVYDGVFSVRADGTVAGANLRAGEMFRAAPGEFAGGSVFPLFCIDGGELRRQAQIVLTGGGFFQAETRCLRRDGSSFQGEVAVGRVAGQELDAPLCVVVRDISVRHKAQQDLRHALERMEAISRARMEFVSNVSHELRTPLTSMIYAVKNMQNGLAGAMGEKAKQYLERLEADCQRLLGTVNDILDLRQMENHTLVLVKRRMAPMVVAREAADSLRVQANAKNIRISVEEVPRIDFCLGDIAKMERVFINIIGNAIKFTPSGGTISVETARDDALPGMTLVKITDTGVGIPAEDIPKVTARYFQVGDQPVGTGLGLAITKELLELHGGKLKIESPPKGAANGTCVTVALPIAEAPNFIVIGRADSAFAAAVVDGLRRRDIKFTRINGGHEAVRACVEHRPDIVALCGDTDDMSATEFVTKTRNDRRLRDLPIVFFREGGGATDATARLMDAFRVPIITEHTGEREAVAAILRGMRA